MAEIVLPELGETVTEGTIIKWFKQVGDRIEEDEALFEVSTDKIDTEVPSPAGGWLAAILVPEGETVDVGTPLAVLSDSPPPEDGEPAPAPAAESAQVPESVPAGRAASSGNGSSPAAGRLLSPVVRRLIEENRIDPDRIEGTGVGGRITRADVLDAIDAGNAEAAPGSEYAPTPAAAPSRPSAPSVAAVPTAGEGAGETAVPLSNIRRRTGEHMVMSKATSPHVITAIAVDYEGVERARLPRREQWKADEGFSLTYLPFISRAVIDALADFPHMNATVGEGQLIVHNHVNLAVAVDLEHQGLLAPVIRDAESRRLRAIAGEINDLATRARSKKLSADEITGGTFTVSNSGNYGTLFVAPIINQPQVAILSTDGISRRPVVVTDPEGNEAIAIHSVGNLTLSWDHRAFDGAYAAAFMERVRDIIEGRDWNGEF